MFKYLLTISCEIHTKEVKTSNELNVDMEQLEVLVSACQKIESRERKDLHHLPCCGPHLSNFTRFSLIPGQLTCNDSQSEMNPKLWVALSGGKVVVFDAASWSMLHDCIQLGELQVVRANMLYWNTIFYIYIYIHIHVYKGDRRWFYAYIFFLYSLGKCEKMLCVYKAAFGVPQKWEVLPSVDKVCPPKISCVHEIWLLTEFSDFP